MAIRPALKNITDSISLHEDIYRNFESHFQSEILRTLAYPERLENIDNYCRQFFPRNTKPSNLKIELEKKRKQKQFEEDRRKYLEQKMRQCFLLYLNASSAEKCLPVILGDDTLRSSPDELVNFGIIFGEETCLSERFMSLFHDSKPGPTGGILCEKGWDITKNDAAMLGAIDNLREFHVFHHTDKISAKDLWDEDEKRPRVLGREIIFLLESGYKITIHDKDMGMSFVPPEKGKSKMISYSDILHIIENLKDWETFKAYLDKHNIPHE